MEVTEQTVAIHKIVTLVAVEVLVEVSEVAQGNTFLEALAVH